MTSETTRLTVDGGGPAVRIEVLDAAFRTCALTYGALDLELPPGIYQVCFSAGDVGSQTLIFLEPGERRTLAAPALAFSSAAPLAHTVTVRAAHRAAAQRLSRAPARDLGIGSGAALFLFVRDTAPGGDATVTDGLSLTALDGTAIGDLTDLATPDDGTEPERWSGLHLALPPGAYRLRYRLTADYTVETMVHLCPTWQSQVFLFRRPASDRESWRVDLCNACYMMSPLAVGFRAEDSTGETGPRTNPDRAAQDPRLTALAGDALTRGEPAIATEDLHHLLGSQWPDPWFGILGAHLLMMRPAPDLDLVQQVVARLRDSVQGYAHPDIDALALDVGLRRGAALPNRPIAAPPLLRRSWQTIVAASSKSPALINRNSLAGAIGDRLWGSGAWLAWEQPAAPVPVSRPGTTPHSNGKGGSSTWIDVVAMADALGVRSKGSDDRIIDEGDRLRIGAIRIPKHIAESFVAGAANMLDDIAGETARDEGEPIDKWSALPTATLAANPTSVSEAATAARDMGGALIRFRRRLGITEKVRIAITRLQERYERDQSFDVADLSAALDALAPKLEQWLGRADIGRLATRLKAEGTEIDILLYLQSLGRHALRHATPPGSNDLSLDTLVARLGLPAIMIVGAIVSLLDKLMSYVRKA